MFSSKQGATKRQPNRHFWLRIQQLDWQRKLAYGKDLVSRCWQELRENLRYVPAKAWISGALPALFFIAIACFAPRSLPVYLHVTLSLLAALLCGIFGFILSSELGFRVEPIRSRFGETGVNFCGALLTFSATLLWCFSPWAPVRPNPGGTMDSTKAERAVDRSVAALPDEMTLRPDRIIIQHRWLAQKITPEPSLRARQLAREIPTDAGPLALGLKAIAEQRFEAARQLLSNAQAQGGDTAAIYKARGLAEQYAGHYAEAVPWFEKILALQPDDPGLLVGTAAACHLAAKYPEAESLYRRALTIQQRSLGHSGADVINTLNYLAVLYYAEGRQADAEALLKQILLLGEKVLGRDHLEIARGLDNLAGLYYDEGKFSKAEPLLQRALAIREKTLGADHPTVADSLDNLAALYDTQTKPARAEPLLQRALVIREKTLGADHPTVADNLSNIADSYRVQGKYADAEPLLQRALAIREKTLGADHPAVIQTLETYALLLRKMNRDATATPLEARIKAILAKRTESYPEKSIE